MVLGFRVLWLLGDSRPPTGERGWRPEGGRWPGPRAWSQASGFGSSGPGSAGDWPALTRPLRICRLDTRSFIPRGCCDQDTCRQFGDQSSEMSDSQACLSLTLFCRLEGRVWGAGTGERTERGRGPSATVGLSLRRRPSAPAPPRAWGVCQVPPLGGTDHEELPRGPEKGASGATSHQQLQEKGACSRCADGQAGTYAPRTPERVVTGTQIPDSLQRQ